MTWVWLDHKGLERHVAGKLVTELGKLGLVVHIYYLSTSEDEAERS